jgi:hypothetical protein
VSVVLHQKSNRAKTKAIYNTFTYARCSCRGRQTGEHHASAFTESGQANVLPYSC